jgi:ATP-dependent Clp protease ATP-binding subunit ClpC
MDESIINFTPRAMQVLTLARQEAARLHNQYVGTDHLLLALTDLKPGEGVAAIVLEKMELNLEAVRSAVEKQVGAGPEPKSAAVSFSLHSLFGRLIGRRVDSKSAEEIPLVPRVKKVLKLAGEESRTLKHHYIGSEHILLGLLREGEGVGARALKGFNVDYERCRKEILTVLERN